MSTKQIEIHETTIPVPDKVKVALTKRMLYVEGQLGKTRKDFKKIPVDLSVDGNILVENFQGERAPRVSKIRGDTKVVTKGDDVILTGPVLTDVSQTAASLQQNTKVKNKDHRVFLDGIYLFEKTSGIEK